MWVGLSNREPFYEFAMNENIARSFSEIAPDEVGGVVYLTEDNGRFKIRGEFLVCHSAVVPLYKDPVPCFIQGIRNFIAFVVIRSLF